MKQESLARALGEHGFVTALEAAHIDFLAGCAKNLRLLEGAYLFREGDEADQLFLLREGKVSLEIHHPTRGILVAETLHRDEVLGWSTLFAPYRWHLSGRTARDSRLFAIDGACLRAKLEQDHDFGYAFTRLMLREVHRRLERVRLQILDVYRA
jgi:CRP/FNR family transcriptional regulator, cyclic AMP receptor protein